MQITKEQLETIIEAVVKEAYSWEGADACIAMPAVKEAIISKYYIEDIEDEED